MQKIAIHSVPRSGSTWLGEIFNSSPDTIYKYQPLFSYAFKSRLNENSSSNAIEDFFKELASSKDAFLDQIEKREKGNMPKFSKNKNPQKIVYKEVRYHNILENMLQQSEGVKIIGLVRNPLAVVNSWLKAPKEFRKDLGWSEMDEWQFSPSKNLNKAEEFNGYEKWKEVALLFEKFNVKYPNNFKMITYNDLMLNTFEVTQELFDFCQIELSDQTLNFLKESNNIDQSREAYSVYRIKKDDNIWNSQLNPKIIDTILKDLKGTSLEKYLK